MIAPINRIIRSSVVDGPGNRYVVFFQGCNFRCQYCHNPETMALCDGCGLCVPLCPAGALTRPVPGGIQWDAAACAGCDACIHACPRSASPRVTWMSVQDVLDDVARCRPFLRGITCSGGECMLHAEFMEELFRGAAAMGLSCLIDSNGAVDFSDPARAGLLSLCEGVMLDIKAVDPARHRALTGCDNAVVLRNAVWLAGRGKLAEVRTVAAGCLDNAGTVDAAARLLAPYLRFGPIRYRIAAFRPFGVRPEHRAMGTPDARALAELADIARSRGFTDVAVV